MLIGVGGAPGVFAPEVSVRPSGVGVGPLRVVPGPPAVTQAPSSGGSSCLRVVSQRK